MKTLIIGTIVVAALALGAWLLGVFTLPGVAYAFWPWADDTGLLWPLGTRLVWWSLLVEAAVVVVMGLIWREGRLECATYRDLWLAAHVSLVHRLRKRTLFAVAGAKVALAQHRRHRPVEVPATASAVVEPQDATSEERAA